MHSFKTLLTALCLLNLPLAISQQSVDNPGAGEGRISAAEQIAKSRGEIVSKGTNERPMGKLHIKSYRIERVKLEKPLQMTHGAPIEFAYRLLITGDNFGGAYTVWIDDEPHFAWTYNPSTVLLIAYGTPKWRDGAIVSLTEGHNTCQPRRGSESVLPDRVSLPPELRALPSDMNRLRLRTLPSAPEFRGMSGVKVQVRTDEPIDNGRNEALMIQIGRQEFPAWGTGTTASATIPSETFWRLPDNAKVLVKWGRCTDAYFFATRLNKTALDH